MERPRPDFGIQLWMGSTGTSRDLNPDQAEAVLIPKEDIEPSTEPETQRQLNLLDMKQFQCCIIQINDANGEPITNPLIYALLFNDITTANFWVCTGEVNDKDIFHVHAMVQTASRSDACRRSMYTAITNLGISEMFRTLFGQTITLECLKIERTHKPSSMLTYLMKNPIWLLSNRMNILQTCYDIWNLDLAARFRTDTVKQPEMNPMTEEIINAIIESGAKSIDDILRTHPSIIAKYLHKPSLDTIIRNCLLYVRCTGGEWSLKTYEKYEPDPRAIHRVLLHQGIVPSTFDQIFYDWITKQDPKKNTIVLYGPSNSGKSAFIAGLKQNIPWGEIVNATTFAFEGLKDSVIGIWEEPLISPEVAEKAKQIFEGMTCSIPIKFKQPHKLPRTPIIMTTNHHPWRFCTQEEPMFKNRMWIFNWDQMVKDQPYSCRASEHSCECGHCRASRGSTTPYGESESCSMQRGEQSLPTREEPIWSSTQVDVGSGSMRDPGEGTSRSYDSSCRSSSSSTNIQCSDSTRSAISSSTSIERFLGHSSNKSSNSGNRISSTESQSTKQLESHDSIRGAGYDSSGDGNSGSRQQFIQRSTGGNGNNSRQHDSISSMVGMGSRKTHKSPLPIQSKKRKLDRKVASLNPHNIPLYIPDKEDWKSYLAYLQIFYG